MRTAPNRSWRWGYSGRIVGVRIRELSVPGDEVGAVKALHHALDAKDAGGAKPGELVAVELSGTRRYGQQAKVTERFYRGAGAPSGGSAAARGVTRSVPFLLLTVALTHAAELSLVGQDELVIDRTGLSAFVSDEMRCPSSSCGPMSSLASLSEKSKNSSLVLPSGVRPIIGVSTSITAFVGSATRK